MATKHELAYFDSFKGLVPCRVLRVDGSDAVIQFTATRGPFTRGDKAHVRACDCVKRSQVFTRNGVLMIRG